MRKTSLLVLGVLVLGPVLSNVAYAGEPIPGVDVKLTHGGLMARFTGAVFASPGMKSLSQIVRTDVGIKQKETSVFGQAVTFTATLVPPPKAGGQPSILIGSTVSRPAEFRAASPGEPIPGVDIYLGKNPGGIIATTTTDANGAFSFSKVGPGKLDLIVGGKRIIAVSVGADGFLVGHVGKGIIKGEDSSIFDRWGNMIAITANAKGQLALAQAAFSAGSFNEAYALSRAAETALAGIDLPPPGDIDGDGPEQIAVPKKPVSPTPVNDPPKAAPSSTTIVPDPTPVNDPPKPAPAPTTTRPVPPVVAPKGE